MLNTGSSLCPRGTDMFCQYYQAIVHVPDTWFVGGLLRNEDNLVFERTMDGNSGVIELFVADEQEAELVDLLGYLVRAGYLLCFEKKENRIKREIIDLHQKIQIVRH